MKASLLAGAGALTWGKSMAENPPQPLKGHVHHSVSRWCFGKISLEDLCRFSKEIGIESVELLGPEDWDTVKKFGLTCAMPSGPGGIAEGWNRVENHDHLVSESERYLAMIQAAGFSNMILMSGNRRGLSDEEGIENCVKGLQRILPLAEKLGITLCMELLNSKVDHKDYQCDHTAWGAELAGRLSSERFKLLYDIYHMQIMEGDIIRIIRDNIKWIGHFHTAGNPGRNDLDDTQEMNYTGICRAIAATGYDLYVGHEFRPKGDPIAALHTTFAICDQG